LIITPGNPVVDYDPDGLAFGIGIDSQIIGLYDIRNHEKVKTLILVLLLALKSFFL
jgi:hypothetical protein